MCIKDTMASTIRKSDYILNVGCGISRMAEEMLEDGYEKIHSIDISPIAVKFMSDKCRRKKEEFKCRWQSLDEIMDIRKLTFEDSKFDVIVDKATLDCFFVAGIHPVWKRLHRLGPFDSQRILSSAQTKGNFDRGQLWTARQENRSFQAS